MRKKPNNSKLLFNQDETLDSMRRLYIAQVQKNDPNPQKVMLNKRLDSGLLVFRLSRRSIYYSDLKIIRHSLYFDCLRELAS